MDCQECLAGAGKRMTAEDNVRSFARLQCGKTAQVYSVHSKNHKLQPVFARRALCKYPCNAV